MKGNSIPDINHVTRYCGGSRVKEDGTISGDAFRLRKLRGGQVEEYLSTNWLELLGKENRVEEIGEVQKILALKMQCVGSTARIAVLNVGETCGYVKLNSDDKRILRVLHEPSTKPYNDPSHSGIHNLKLEDALIADLIAQTVKEVYPAKAL